MICKHLNWLGDTNEVGVPFFKGSDNGKEFLFVYFAVAFSRRVLLRKESDRLEYSFVIRL